MENKAKVAAVYVRVSTDDKGQNPDLQLADCKPSGYDDMIDFATIIR